MHGRTHRTIGLTLIEMTLVLATIVLMVGLALPAVKGMIHSFHSEGAARSMIGAALNSARTMAVTKQRYVGVRFQAACVSDDLTDPLKGLLDAPQYLVFIMHDERRAMGGESAGFRAVEGLQPIKLPDTIGVMDLTGVTDDASVNALDRLSNATTFSIVFSPSGRVLVQDVRVRNRDGLNRPDNGTAGTSNDDVFNSTTNVIQYRCGMFIQDDYGANPALGLGQEPSRTSFVVYDRVAFRRAYEKGVPWTLYLQGLSLQSLYVSPYTGHLISAK